MPDPTPPVPTATERERCAVCDRPVCKDDAPCDMLPGRCHYAVINRHGDMWCQTGEARMLDDGDEGDCEARSINWRGRALAAEQALATARAAGFREGVEASAWVAKREDSKWAIMRSMEATNRADTARAIQAGIMALVPAPPPEVPHAP